MTAASRLLDATTQALENQFGLADRLMDEAARDNSVERFRAQGITLPTFAQLEDPSTFDQAIKVGDADPQGPDARNLWRVHWDNDLAGNRVSVPDHDLCCRRASPASRVPSSSCSATGSR